MTTHEDAPASLSLGGSLEKSDFEPEATQELIRRAEASTQIRYASANEIQFWVAEIQGLHDTPAWVTYADHGQTAYSLHSQRHTAEAEFEDAVKSAEPDCDCTAVDEMAEHVCTIDDRWNTLDPTTRALLSDSDFRGA